MDLKNFFDLNWDYIDTSEGLQIIAHDSVVKIPLSLKEYREVDRLFNSKPKENEVGVYLLRYGEYYGEKTIFAIGIDVNVGEIGNTPVFILRPQLGLYELYETSKIFKEQVRDKGRGIILHFPKFEKDLEEYISQVLRDITKNMLFGIAKRERIDFPKA